MSHNLKSPFLLAARVRRASRLARLWGATLFCAVLCGACKPPPPPVFLGRGEPPSLSEVMAQPPGYLYGSSINLWAYTGSDGTLAEVAVTGHADSSTCRQMSGLVFNTQLEKYREPEDFFVAGAAWLTQHEDTALRKQLEADPKVQAYRRTSGLYRLLRFEQAIASQIPVKSEGSKSALKEITQKVDELTLAKQAAEKEEVVANYLRNQRSSEVFSSLLQEAQRLQESTGLVRVRRLPQKLATDVRERIQAAARQAKPQVLSFADLLSSAPDREAVVMTDMLHIGTGDPVSVSIPLAELLSSEYEAARAANRDAVKEAMIGDAENRKIFYEQKKQEIQEKQKLCAELSESERRQPIVLNQTCTADGDCYESTQSSSMTRGEYCEIQLKINAQIIQSWQAAIAELLAKIKDDAERERDSTVEAISQTSLIEAMLRDWELPVGRDQSAFAAWGAKMRPQVWKSLFAALARMGLKPAVMGGQSLVFNVRVKGDQLIVRPVYALDLARGVVVVDPKTKVTRILDGWAQRRLEAVPPPPPDSGIGTAEQAVLSSLHHAVSGANDQAAAALRQGIERWPTEATKELEKQWLALMTDDQQVLAEMRERAAPAITAADALAALDELKASPQLQEDPVQYLLALRRLLKTYPDLPAELHLQLAIDVAELVQLRQRAEENGTKDEQRTLGDPWAVITAYSDAQELQDAEQALRALRADKVEEPEASKRHQEGVSRTRRFLSQLERETLTDRVDRYRFGRIGVAILFMEDPALIVRDAIHELRQRDPAYLKQANKVRGIPKIRSESGKKYLALMEPAHSPLAIGVIELSRTTEMLQRSSWVEQAAYALLVTPKDGLIDLSGAQNNLEAALRPGLTRPDDRIKQVAERLTRLHDTTGQTLTLQELAATLMHEHGALLRQAHRVVAEHEISLGAWRDSLPLSARLAFEMGEYQRALDALFAEKTAAVLYAPGLKWQPLDLKKGVALNDLQVAQEPDALLVKSAAQQGKKGGAVVRISGIPAEDLPILQEHLQDALSRGGAASDDLDQRVMGSQVPVRRAAARWRGVFMAPELRLLLLKSMVYGCAVPDQKLIAPGGRCATVADQRRRYEQLGSGQSVKVVVPSLEAITSSAQSSLQH